MNILTPYLKHKSHIIWDWNGTLLNDIDHAVRTVNHLLTEEGLNPVDLDAYRKTFGFPVIDYYKALGFNIERENFLRLCDNFNERFYSGLAHCELWPGARELLTDIRSDGKMQSVLSASEHSKLIESLDQFAIRHLFDHVYGIFDKTAASKVERGLELISKVSVSKEATILIGDTDHDLEVGEAMGIDVLLVEHGHQCPLKLKSKHHTVVKVL